VRFSSWPYHYGPNLHSPTHCPEVLTVSGQAVRSLYSGSKVHVRVDGVGVGLGQGCVLSPLLFLGYVNWMDSRSRDEGVTVGTCRINRLLFVDNLVLLASFKQGLQHDLDRFSAVCDPTWIKISTKESKGLYLSRDWSQCMLQVSGSALQQIE